MERDEIELGDEALEVRRRPRAGVVVSVRISAQEADQLQRLAEERDTTVSQVAREALTSYLMVTTGGHPPAGFVTVASSPWTGTRTTDFQNLEFNYGSWGPIARTGGQAEQATARTTN